MTLLHAQAREAVLSFDRWRFVPYDGDRSAVFISVAPTGPSGLSFTTTLSAQEVGELVAKLSAVLEQSIPF